MVYVPEEALKGWRQMPVNLSFLEVIHNGGLSADQAKNVQLIFRKKKQRIVFNFTSAAVSE